MDKNKVVKSQVGFEDNITVFEEKVKSYVNYYAIFVVIAIILLSIYTAIIFESGDKIDLSALASSAFVGLGGWAALKTWQVSFIFNLKQNRRAMTMQKMLSHQQSNIYQESKLTLRNHFPDCVNSLDVKPIPLISSLKIKSKENSDKACKDSSFEVEEIEAIENAIEGILNAYEGFAAAIIQGYVDEAYLKDTIRGQVVNVCSLLSHNIKEVNSKCSKALEHLIEIYDLWHEEEHDGQKCILRGSNKTI